MKIEVKTGKCKVCKDFFKDNTVHSNRLKSVGICYSCDFWIEKWNMRNDDNVVRIDNQHYIISSNQDRSKGMSGSGFVIKFDDGRILTTYNLWHQGQIPERFRSILPNNAKFI